MPVAQPEFQPLRSSNAPLAEVRNRVAKSRRELVYNRMFHILCIFLYTFGRPQWFVRIDIHCHGRRAGL